MHILTIYNILIFFSRPKIVFLFFCGFSEYDENKKPTILCRCFWVLYKEIRRIFKKKEKLKIYQRLWNWFFHGLKVPIGGSLDYLRRGEGCGNGKELKKKKHTVFHEFTPRLRENCKPFLVIFGKFGGYVDHFRVPAGISTGDLPNSGRMADVFCETHVRVKHKR